MMDGRTDGWIFGRLCSIINGWMDGQSENGAMGAYGWKDRRMDSHY